MSKAPVFQALDELVSKAYSLEQELYQQYDPTDPTQRKECHNHVWTILMRDYDLWRTVKEYPTKLEEHIDMLVKAEVEYYGSTLYLSILLYEKYMEISESCSDAPSEEDYEACLEEVLREVDKECIADIDVEIKVKGELEIKSWAVSCGGDYCVCGNEFEVIIDGGSPSNSLLLLSKYYDKILELIERLMAL